MSMLGFQTLHCPKCGKTEVVQIGSLKWQEGKGQAFSTDGFYCLWCMVRFDTEGAIRAIKAKELRDKIKELEAASGQ